MTIYLDVVLLENIILNYIIIFATSIISKTKTSHIRITISSLIGGLFAIVNYFSDLNFYINVCIKVFVSVFMMVVAFKILEWKKILKLVVFFYFVSFMFGGIAFMLLFIVNPQNIIMKNNYLLGTYPMKITALAGISGLIMIVIVSKIIKIKMQKNTMIYELEIFYNGKAEKLKTLLDTGNLLKEPISNLDVIIAEKDSLKGIIEEDVLENIKNIIKGKWIEKNNLNSLKIKIIPFSSLGNDNGLLIGFKPVYVKINGDESIIRNDVLIGIYDGKLSRSNMYSSLIGLDILNTDISKNNVRQNGEVKWSF